MFKNNFINQMKYINDNRDNNRQHCLLLSLLSYIKLILISYLAK